MDEQMRSDVPATTGAGEELTPHGVTADCITVQTDLLSLTKLLAGPELDTSAEYRKRCLEATRAAQRTLCAHRTDIEGPAGLFAYIDEGVPQCTGEVTELCEQHCALGRCLDGLEAVLSAPDAGEPANIERARASGILLTGLIRRHQASLGHLMSDASMA